MARLGPGGRLVDPALARVAAVALGGAIGASARWGLDLAMGLEAWPAATLAANLLGTFVLAVLSGRLGDSITGVGVRVGLLGSFTTFSAFAVQLVELASRPVPALLYLVTSLAGGVAIAHLGLRLGPGSNRFVHPDVTRPHRPTHRWDGLPGPRSDPGPAPDAPAADGHGDGQGDGQGDDHRGDQRGDPGIDRRSGDQ